MGEATINGFKMHFLDVGSGEALVLLHGLGGNGLEWEAQIELFSHRYRVIAPDLRGHGRSDPPTTPAYTPFDHAKDVVALLDHLGIPTAWVVGLSMGGFVTLALALRSPERVRGTVLAATSPSVSASTRAVGQRWMEVFQREGLDAYLTRLIRDIFSGEFAASHAAEVQRFLESQKHRNLAGIAPSGVGNLGFDVTKELPSIHLPTLIIHGQQDMVVEPGAAQLLRQSIPGAELCMLPGTGHIVIVERAVEFNELVMAFLGRPRSPGGVPDSGTAIPL